MKKQDRCDILDLISKVKSGDEQAFKTLFYKYCTQLCLWAYKITGNKQAAEDIVQDFFIRFWNKKEALEFFPSFLSYAYRSIYNASLNYIRDNEKYVYNYNFTFMGIPEVEAESDFDKELEIRLMDAIQQLPDKCRKIFVMVTLEKKRHSDVADHFGISVNTVKVQVSKAYHILRKKLGVFFFL